MEISHGLLWLWEIKKGAFCKTIEKLLHTDFFIWCKKVIIQNAKICGISWLRIFIHHYWNWLLQDDLANLCLSHLTFSWSWWFDRSVWFWMLLINPNELGWFQPVLLNLPILSDFLMLLILKILHDLISLISYFQSWILWLMQKFISSINRKLRERENI